MAVRKMPSLLERLVSFFDGFENVPIEIDDVRDHIISLGVQDEIIFVESDVDPSKLQGMIKRYVKRNGVYAEPLLCSLIVYSQHLSMEKRRVACAKELIHILDNEAAATNTSSEVAQLINRLFQRTASEEVVGDVDFMVAKDLIAQYQALALLFPDAVRERVLPLYRDGKMSLKSIADMLCIPESDAEVVLADFWPNVKADLIKW